MKQEMQVNVSDFYDEVLGHASIAKVSSYFAGAQEDLMECSVSLRTPPLVTFVLDSSGSMEQNIGNAKLAALALVDILPRNSRLRVLLFDTKCLEILSPTVVDAESREPIKAKLRECLTCLGGGTNIELPVVDMLSAPSCICFVSDGLANVGFNCTSDALLEIARKCPAYSESIINTLGIQFDPTMSLNAKLLKDLATDTGGIFTIAKDSETLQTFVGQILGTFYFQRGKFKISMRASNGVEAVCETPFAGCKLRADKPTNVLFKWNQEPKGNKTCITHLLEPGCAEEITQVTRVEIQPCNAEDEFRIVAALVAKYLEGKGPPKEVVEAVERLSRRNDKLIPLVVALNRPPAVVDSAAYVNVSAQAYEYKSMGGGELTPALLNLGHLTQMLSQSQNP